MWDKLEPNPPHLSYLIVSCFLITYAIFSLFIRNRLHLSEPPLALLIGILFGPYCINALDPIGWHFQDEVTYEFSRIILGLQVFVVGLELPKGYLPKHFSSVLMLLGPVMAFGWAVCACFIKALIPGTTWPSALLMAACLTPTDPVLAASVLSGSQFSTRLPTRIKHLLSCESGCNDGSSFPFLYIGIAILTNKSAGPTIRDWFLITILYQCVLGIVIGLAIGFIANRGLKYADEKKLIGETSFIVFYLLLAILSVGIASTLGIDDFLVAFSAGASFSHDGWFASRTRDSSLNNILDLMLNSTFFVYLGTVLPWESYVDKAVGLTPWRLFALLALVLLFRRIPVLLAMKRFIPDIRTYSEAIFCGHFGPMGVGAVFLAMESRSELESAMKDNPEQAKQAMDVIWPVVSFIVLGSTVVHGLSVAAMSVGIHLRRPKEERDHWIGGETEPIGGMVHEESDIEEEEQEESFEERGERRNEDGEGRVRLE
jgi:NhaP-type Na+/H+ or K+/H+ antiporter